MLFFFFFLGFNIYLKVISTFFPIFSRYFFFYYLFLLFCVGGDAGKSASSFRSLFGLVCWLSLEKMSALPVFSFPICSVDAARWPTSPTKSTFGAFENEILGTNSTLNWFWTIEERCPGQAATLQPLLSLAIYLAMIFDYLVDGRRFRFFHVHSHGNVQNNSNILQSQFKLIKRTLHALAEHI